MLNNIYQSLDPVAFAIGPFAMRWYGIAYVLGFVCAALVVWRVARRWRVRVDVDSLLTIMFCVIVGVILGGAWATSCFTAMATTWLILPRSLRSTVAA